MDSILVVNAPSVAGEVIDGEAVIMNLATGHYFSTQGSGAVIWAAISAGASRPEIVAELHGRFAAPPDEVVRAVNTFVDDLLRHELIVESAAQSRPAAAQASTPPATDSVALFQPPVLHVYTDMDDLLLLDPIHDVDEAGWPTPKPSPTTG